MLFITRLAIDRLPQTIKMPNRILKQGLLIWEYPAQRRVQEDGHNEAEQPVERIQVLDASVDMDFAGVPATRDDGLSKARQQRCNRDDEGDEGTPVAARHWAGKAVAASGVVKRRDIVMLPLDEPIVSGKDTRDGR